MFVGCFYFVVFVRESYVCCNPPFDFVWVYFQFFCGFVEHDPRLILFEDLFFFVSVYVAVSVLKLLLKLFVVPLPVVRQRFRDTCDFGRLFDSFVFFEIVQE